VLRRWEPLARYLACRFAGRAEREDLEQVARIGLLQATRRFDPARGCPFPAYAIPTIVNAIRRYLRDQQRAIRIAEACRETYRPLRQVGERLAPVMRREPTAGELATGLDVGEADVGGLFRMNEVTRLKPLDEPCLTPWDEEVEPLAERMVEIDTQLEAVEQQLAIRQAVQRLPQRLREIVQKRYFQGQTQTEVARAVGVSQMHVSRLERRALAYLREALHRPAHRAL
jgi:RNA polymerase sigma-B factor